MKEGFTYDNRAMEKNVCLLTIACFLLCLNFNYTLPLHDTKNTNIPSAEDVTAQAQSDMIIDSQVQHDKQAHTGGIVDRTKKMAVNFENALRKFIDVTPKVPKAKCSHSKQGVVDNDLSHYEQLVIMKKYPFLDLQELDFHLRPSAKNTRQNLNSAQVLQDPSFCEFIDEAPNVEITNRGLSGFALPTKLIIDKTDNNNNLNNTTNVNMSSSTKEPPDELRLIESLEEDIKIFEQRNLE